MTTVSQMQVNSVIRVKLALTGPELSGQTITADALDPGTQNLTASTTPPVSLYLAETITIDGGTQTIGLDSFTDSEGNTVSGVGKKVQVVRIITPSGNAADIVVKGAAADPYELWGATNEVDIPPGTTFGPIQFNEQLADIGPTSGGGATDITFTGTSGDTCTIELGIG